MYICNCIFCCHNTSDNPVGLAAASVMWRPWLMLAHIEDYLPDCRSLDRSYHLLTAKSSNSTGTGALVLMHNEPGGCHLWVGCGWDIGADWLLVYTHARTLTQAHTRYYYLRNSDRLLNDDMGSGLCWSALALTS